MLNKLSVGIDGCKAGWFAFFQQQNQISFAVFSHLEALIETLTEPADLFIDMPIGFPDPGQTHRECDRLVRAKLPGRAGSVFPVPCKAAVYAENYAKACDINRQRIGKAFPIQTWNIIPKIKELDTLLTKLKSTGQSNLRFYESHPELLFASLAGNPMQHNKSTAEGRAERLTYLAAALPSEMNALEQALRVTAKKQAKPDDILDAFVLMHAASQTAAWQSVPSALDRDHDGNTRQIYYLSVNNINNKSQIKLK